MRMEKTSFGSAKFLKSLEKDIKPQFADTTDLKTFLSTPGVLSYEDRSLLVEQALVLLEMFYVHMPLKRAMHAIDPVQQLRLIKYRLSQTPEDKAPSELDFHKEMLKVFNSLRDLHTNYLLPAPFGDKTAFLPFMIEEYFENGERKYVVSKLVEGFSHPKFEIGVEVLYWNGTPIDRAVEINADRQAGSNPEARHARGLDSMTIRPMIVTMPPDEEWVAIVYRSLDGEELELKQNWIVTSLRPVFVGADPDSTTGEAKSLGIDIKTQAIQDAKKALFAPRALVAEKRIAEGEISRAAPADALETSMPGVLKAQRVDTPHGAFGYIRVYTFNVNNADKFLSEILRLAELLPQEGLIIDVRDNGGGLIWASERLLQTLTPHWIKPEPAQFINTPLSLELCRRDSQDLSPWLKSVEQSIETGAVFSQGFPITPEDACNNMGQRYYGPVILITDALCYSATDIFAAGFQDNEVGPILGTNWNTGAGGANVWTHELIRMIMGDDSPIKPLTNGSGMRVSIRRLLRVNEREGTPLEDLGVVPTHKHDMTKDDVLNGNVDLINHAAKILAGMTSYVLSAKVSPSANRKLDVSAETKNISRLDVFAGGRPQLSLDVANNSAQFVIERPPRGALSFIELRGYSGNELVAVKRIKV
jgi:hypothetical protein